jgi:hypothetical protein
MYEELNVRVEDDYDRDDGAGGHYSAPETDNDVTCHDFERYESGFEDEEVPSCCYAECVVYEASSETNKWRRDWQVSHHFRNT